MKVGILTFPNSISYGASLQMYALYRAVQTQGHVPEIVNYHNAYMKAERHHDKQATSSVAKRFLHTRVRMLLHHRLYAAFHRFEAKYMAMYPTRAFSKKERLIACARRYGAVICGSDQVWNPHITDSDMSYFLDFCGEGTRRISYAPSFGVETFSVPFAAAVQTELAGFSAVSVREASGARWLASLGVKDVSVVADPTFLLEEREWQTIEKKHPAAEGEYILYFTVHRSDKLFQRCRAWAQQSGIKMIAVGGNPFKRWKNRDPLLEYAVDISPDEWLYLMRHARYVVTDSFHGTAFSVIFRKDFFVQYPPHANVRLVHLIEELGLCDRVISPDTAFHTASVIYDAADRRRTEMKTFSQQFLTNALEG